MKTLRIFLFICFIGLTACSSDDVEIQPTDDLSGLHLVTEFSNDTHHIELYSATGTLQTGFNPISLRIKETATDNYLTHANISWLPIMYMTDMEHAAPASEVVKTPGTEALFSGHLIFTMPENPDEKWEINITYQSQESNFSASIPVEVPEMEDRNLVNFTGSDDQNYVLAMVAPFEPKVAINDIQMVLYRMESMMAFEPVDDFSILIDPRMPGMGNHGSPNNVDLTPAEDGFYRGALSLTMTGLWRINLQVLDASKDVIKGEEVTQDNPDSSIYLQFEF